MMITKLKDANPPAISLPIRDQVADILRRQIFTSRLKPGEQIHVRELSRSLGVSTTPVKEAVRMLNTEGLLFIEPRKGTFVAQVIGNQILEMILIRSSIEGTAAYFGTKYITDPDIGLMEELLHEAYAMSSDKSKVKEMSQINARFHSLLSSSCNNAYLIQLVEKMASINDTVRHRALSRGTEAYEQDHREHMEILQAVRKRDAPHAERVTVSHIRRVGKSVMLDLTGAASS